MERHDSHEALGFSDSDHVETETLLPSDSSSRGGTDNNTMTLARPLGGTDVSSLSGRVIWRHFELEKASAIHHLGRYIDRCEIWRKLQPTVPSPLNLGR